MEKFEKELAKLLKLIATGKAVLFAGAGFSINSTNLNGKSIPLVRDLIAQICEKLLNDEICEEIDNLEDAAEEAIENNKSQELINLLEKLYCVKKVHHTNKSIVQLPWRRIYTTNYDDVIEKAGSMVGINFYSATPSVSPDVLSKKSKICFHINGYIHNLTLNSLENEFKLSSSSYLKQDPMYETRWGDVFRKDLQFASAIVFIGYSLYDYSIEKLLYENKMKYKEKLYFILEEKPKKRDVRKLQKYGKVLTIGIDKFADFVEHNINIVNDYQNIMRQEFEFFQKCQLISELKDVSHDEIRSFLTLGNYDSNYIYAGLLKNYNNFIDFEWINNLLIYILDINNGFYHINGELGTGKSFALNLLAIKLLQKGEKVFFLKNKYGDYVEDLKKILEFKTRVYLIIDNVDENIEVLNYIYTILADTSEHKIIVISAGRKYIGMYNEIYNKSKNFSISEYLNENEKRTLVQIIKNIGAEKNQNLSVLISTKYNNSLPNFLLDFINSKYIAKSIKEEFNKILNLENGKYIKTLMAICLVGMFQKEIDLNIIKILTNQDYIRESKLLNNESFQNFFRDEYGNIVIKSSIFARYILQNLFLDEIKKNIFLDFIKVANEKKFKQNTNDIFLSLRFEEIFKELIKFYSLAKMFQNNEAILSYFEQVKNELDWLENDPNYWIQLALLNLERKKIDVALDMIATAYKKAQRKMNYEYDYIYTVEARYKIEKALYENNLRVYDIYKLFEEADNLLKKVKPSDNKYRQINKYILIYELLEKRIFFKNHSEEKNNFIRKIKFQLDEIFKIEDNNYEGINKIYLVNSSKDNLNIILQNLEG
jgi:hypothetical protein